MVSFCTITPCLNNELMRVGDAVIGVAVVPERAFPAPVLT